MVKRFKKAGIAKKLNKVVSEVKALTKGNLEIIDYEQSSVISNLNIVGSASTIAINTVAGVYDITDTGVAGVGGERRLTDHISLKSLDIQCTIEQPGSYTYLNSGVQTHRVMLIWVKEADKTSPTTSRYPLLGNVFDMTPAGMTQGEMRFAKGKVADALTGKKNVVVLYDKLVQLSTNVSSKELRIRKHWKNGLPITYLTVGGSSLTNVSRNQVFLAILGNANTITGAAAGSTIINVHSKMMYYN